MFRGNHPTRADEKGRLKVPANFKRELDERYSGNRFYITSRDGKAAEVYPIEEWEKIERRILEKPSANPAVRRFIEATSFYGQETEMDAQGRLLLPVLLREKANLKGEVAVIGMWTWLQVRNMEALQKQIEENPLTDEDANALSELGI
jgi:MraZ protein